MPVSTPSRWLFVASAAATRVGRFPVRRATDCAHQGGGWFALARLAAFVVRQEWPPSPGVS